MINPIYFIVLGSIYSTKDAYFEWKIETDILLEQNINHYILFGAL